MSATAVVDAPQHVHDLLQRLHAASLVQEKELEGEDGGYAQIRKAWGKDPAAGMKLGNEMMRDKFIALPVDKALFVYQLLLATGALNVVEAGTSYGVSTIYLAHAVGQNAKAQGKTPGAARVIATEHEPEKAARAREHWNEAGETVLPWIELREGDLLQTLKNDVPEIDFLLLDSKLTPLFTDFFFLMGLQFGHRWSYPQLSSLSQSFGVGQLLFPITQRPLSRDMRNSLHISMPLEVHIELSLCRTLSGSR